MVSSSLYKFQDQLCIIVCFSFLDFYSLGFPNLSNFVLLLVPYRVFIAHISFQQIILFLSTSLLAIGI